MEEVSGPKLKYVKMSVHTQLAARAKLNKAILPGNLAIAEDGNMNFIFSKTPIVTDSFKSSLDERLSCLRKEIRILSELTFLHECFLLDCVVVRPLVR